MLKRCLRCALWLCALFILCPMARAEGASARTFFAVDAEGNQEDYILSTATDGNGLYMLSALRMYEYTRALDDKRLCVDWDDVFAGLNRGQPREELLQEFSDTRADRLVSGEGAVYALNTQTGSLRRWEDGRFIPYGEMDAGASGIAQSEGNVFLRDQRLYYLLPEETEEPSHALCCYDLQTGEVSRTQAGLVYGLCGYTDGNLALLRGLEPDAAGYEIAVFDRRTERIAPLKAFRDRQIGGLGFSEARQCLLFVEAGVVYCLDAVGNVSAVGRMPTGVSMPDWSLYSFADDACALVTPQGIYVRALSNDEENEKTLTLFLRDASRVPGFAQAYPELDIRMIQADGMDAAALAQGLIDGSLRADVFEVDAALLGALIDKGYAAKLPGDGELARETEALYPALQGAVMRQGGLYAVPATMTVHTWRYDTEAWRTILDAPPPETVDAYIDLCAAWLERGEEAVEDFTLRYPGQSLTGQMMLDVLNLYIDQYDRAGEPFTFDAEVLREALGKVLSLQARYGGQAAEVGPPSGYPILRTDNVSFFGEDGTGTPLIPPVFEPGRPPVVSADLTVYFLHAGSVNPEPALRFLEYAAKNRSAAELCMMKPAQNEPVEYPNFAKEKAALIDNLAYLYDARERAEGDAAERIQATIDFQEQLLATAEERRWYISAEDIAAYRDLARYLVVRTTGFSAVQRSPSIALFYELLAQCYHGEIDLDACISRMEEKRRMIELEAAL